MFLKKLFSIRKEKPPELEGYFFRMTLPQLMGKAITVNNITYVPIELIMFADRYEIKFNKFIDLDNFEEIKLVADNTVGQLIPIKDGDITFFWDELNKSFRTIPEEEGELWMEFNPWVKAYSNGELRIEKEYAENNLSRKARSFAYRKTDEFYSWNYGDNSEIPVLFEIPSVFKSLNSEGEYSTLNPDFYNIYGKIDFYCYTYYVYADLDDENIMERYKENLNRKLWQPEAE